jgi:Fe-S cluster biosynthesis and repair protein YggX
VESWAKYTILIKEKRLNIMFMNNQIKLAITLSFLVINLELVAKENVYHPISSNVNQKVGIGCDESLIGVASIS